MKRGIQSFTMLAGVLLISLFASAPASAVGPSQWTVSSTKVPQTLFDISCPSTTLCVATDWDGDLSVSTNPTGGAGTWHPVSIPQIPHMNGVSCPSTTLCVAVGTLNQMTVSTNPAGGSAAWNTMWMQNQDNTALQTVDCPSVSLCVVIDADTNVLTSGNPAGGFGAWSESKETRVPIHSVTYSPFSLSCPSVSLCVSGRELGVSTSTTPAGGAGTWNYAELWVSVFRPVNTMSCPSTNLCVGTDALGNLLTSTNPTGGAGAWSSANMGPDPLDAQFWVTCPTATFCISFDNKGSLLTSENPAAGAGSWSATPLPKPLADVWVAPQQANLLVGKVSCPSVTFCVGLGFDGTNIGTYMVTGTTPGSDPGGGDPPGGNPGTGSSGSGDTPPPLPGTAAKCTVPYLKGKTLGVAKRVLKRSNCRIGTISRPKRKKKGLTVRSQSPKPGLAKPAGMKVSVHLA